MVRQGQFQLLLQCMMDLKQSLAEPLTLTASEKKAVQQDEEDNEENKKNEEEAKPMDTESSETDLYADL